MSSLLHYHTPPCYLIIIEWALFSYLEFQAYITIHVFPKGKIAIFGYTFWSFPNNFSLRFCDENHMHFLVDLSNQMSGVKFLHRNTKMFYLISMLGQVAKTTTNWFTLGTIFGTMRNGWWLSWNVNLITQKEETK